MCPLIGEPHRSGWCKYERHQIGRDIGEGKHLRLQLDAEYVLHEIPPCLNPNPGFKIPGGKLVARVLVCQGNAVLINPYEI